MHSKIQEKFTQLAWLIQEGRIPQAIGFLSQFVRGSSLYTDHLATSLGVDQLPMKVEGNIMYLSLSDTGTSTELFHFGTREREETARMRQTFRRVNQSSDEPVILEIGAHRGYYAFQAADLVGDHGTIYAIEPHPENFAALTKGIEANGFTNICAERCAIGGEETTGTLQMSSKSNSHTLQSIPDTRRDKYTGETIETEVHRVDSYLAEKGVAPEDVDIVKIDVEGYETEVFEGMGALLQADSELLVFVELHPHRVAPSKLQAIIDQLGAAGFLLVHAASSADPDLLDFNAVRQHVERPTGRHSVELIVRRNTPNRRSRSSQEMEIPD